MGLGSGNPAMRAAYSIVGDHPGDRFAPGSLAKSAPPTPTMAQPSATRSRWGLAYGDATIALAVADDGSACVMDGQLQLLTITIANQPVELMVMFG